MKGLSESLAQSGYTVATINGTTYTIELLPAFPAAEVWSRLITLFGPAIGKGVDGYLKQDLILPESNELFHGIAEEFSGSLGNLDVQETISTLLYNVSAGSVKIEDTNQHFKGKFLDFILVIEAALKGNYGGTFLGYCKAKGFEIPSLSEVMKTMIPANPLAEGQEDQSEETEKESKI